jgi:hypothetical protein
MLNGPEMGEISLFVRVVGVSGEVGEDSTPNLLFTPESQWHTAHLVGDTEAIKVHVYL